MKEKFNGIDINSKHIKNYINIKVENTDPNINSAHIPATILIYNFLLSTLLFVFNLILFFPFI